MTARQLSAALMDRPFRLLLPLIVPLVVLGILVASCGATSQPPSSTPTLAPHREQSGESWVYWLQDSDLSQIRIRSERIVVLDYSKDGTEEGAFSRDELEALKRSPAGQKTVLAYMSIGEAESYRSYWQPGWRPGDPEWLDQQNPAWPGNYKVQFWNPQWQRIIFGGPDAYLDRILAAGFDGVYLDIIDAYEEFATRGRRSAEREMVALVRAISAYAKAKAPRSLIIPQNAPELGRYPEYLDAMDGIAQEGVYYGYETEGMPTPVEITMRLEEHLDVFRKAGKMVLVVDYATSAEQVRDAYQKAWDKGYLATASTVALDGAPLGP